MDTIYGTKKYFQNLSGASDPYRCSNGRPMQTQMTYQRPGFGAYHHMTNPTAAPAFKPYNTGSGYNLNTWTMARAPSIYSEATSKFARNNATSRHHYEHRKSFSIILTTAAIIVLLAVIIVAALAYYISSVRMNMDDAIIGFEGSFIISKGDSFSRGMKSNQTAKYKQKIEFYKRFIERALSDNNLVPMHTEIKGFGDGPLIKVHFKTFIDVRMLAQNAIGVEDLIKESIFLETVADKTLYRFLKIDIDSIEVKRILSDISNRKTLEIADKLNNPTEIRVLKKANNKNYLNLLTRSETTTQRSMEKAENASLVHGSFEGFFEITKTDADVTHYNAAPTKSYSASSMAAKAITPHFLRVRNKKPGIEKVIITTTPFTIITTPSTTTTTSTTTTPSTTSTTPSTTTKTTKRSTTTTTTPSTTTTTTPSTTTTTTDHVANSIIKSTTQSFLNHHAHHPVASAPIMTSTKLPFTSFPLLDTQPWKPIPWEYAPKTMPQKEDIKVLDANYKHDYAFNRFQTYKDVERLGAGAQIQPHPLPISLIDEVMSPSLNYRNNNNNNIESVAQSTENVMVELKIIETTPTIVPENTTPMAIKVNETQTEKQVVSTKKPYVWNMREIILKRKNHVKLANNTDINKEPNIINKMSNKTANILDDSLLYPTHSKWQFVNSSSNTQNGQNYSTMSMNLRKVFNKTLQAFVSEDIKGSQDKLTTLDDELQKRLNNMTSLQDISKIFDTLASKLGVTPAISTKMPPLSANKLKQQTNVEINNNPETWERVKSTTLSSIKREEYLDENSSSVEGIGAAIPVFGEAEIEHMDPTKYEELLRSTNFAETSSSSRESLPELVTFLPVRSNSAGR